MTQVRPRIWWVDLQAPLLPRVGLKFVSYVLSRSVDRYIVDPWPPNAIISQLSNTLSPFLFLGHLLNDVGVDLFLPSIDAH